MDIKKAIELLEKEEDYHFDNHEKEYAKEIYKVITLLKEVNNYKEMWEELYKEFFKNQEERNISGYSYMIDMDNIKKKYFP
jgi:hypothetical protein